jgi:hypothetical protein
MTTIANPPTNVRPRAAGAHGVGAGRGALGAYRDRRGHRREIVAHPGALGSVLVVDRDARTRGDWRLLAHLAPDEPARNAAVVCRQYLGRAAGDRPLCRRVENADLLASPFPAERREATARCDASVHDGAGCCYRLELVDGTMSIPELRWRWRPAEPGAAPATLSLRSVVARLERYEPPCSLTRLALARYKGDARVSLTVARLELERVLESPIVLNRRLRETVLDAVRRGELSMSEIALRCGRAKRDRRGNSSGETSWLARRLGLLPEGGQDAPTPWIHSDVLGLIARNGLGTSPREVEL